MKAITAGGEQPLAIRPPRLQPATNADRSAAAFTEVELSIGELAEVGYDRERVAQTLLKILVILHDGKLITRKQARANVAQVIAWARAQLPPEEETPPWPT